ncbi:MAG TPA: hypothetical protein GX399_05140 [Xanthomonadaceae bacterium]|nr:hypothetical protein [Xanthomonadaceae bacterium]
MSAAIESGQRRQASPDGGQRVFLQRIVQFLEQPAPDGRLISGTRISEERLRQLVGFLRVRGQGNHPVAARIRWILAQLEPTAPGEETVAGVGVRQLKRLLRSLPGGGGFTFEESSDSSREQRPDPLAAALPRFDAHLEGIRQVLRSMDETMARLIEQLNQVERELGALAEWRAALSPDRSRQRPVAEGQEQRRDDRSEPDVDGWFSDFLD